MSEKNDGGPAFPGFGQVFTTDAAGRTGPQGLWGIEGPTGMTMRQWYKGMALQGLLGGFSQDVSDTMLTKDWEEKVKNVSKNIATAAAYWADAMIAEDTEFQKEKP